MSSEAWPTTLERDNVDGPALRAALKRTGVVRVRGVEPDAVALVEFLAPLGMVLGYYGGDAGTHPDHAGIWKVRYEPSAAERGEGHAVDGDLPVHSSQSLRAERPPFFAMLMVNPGWQNLAPGLRGESLLVRWSDALAELARESGDAASVRQAALSPVSFPDGTRRSVAYELPNPRHELDLGVRLKSDLLQHLRDSEPAAASTSFVESLVAAGAQTARQLQMAAGDLVVIDNNRWGHGRRGVVGRATSEGGRSVVNPRELWSLTLA